MSWGRGDREREGEREKRRKKYREASERIVQ